MVAGGEDTQDSTPEGTGYSVQSSPATREPVRKTLNTTSVQQGLLPDERVTQCSIVAMGVVAESVSVCFQYCGGQYMGVNRVLFVENCYLLLILLDKIDIFEC